MNLPSHAARGLSDATGANVTTYTQEHRDRLAAAPVPPLPHAPQYVTSQTTPPIKVGTTRGLIAGTVLALLAGLGAAVAVLAANGTDRAAIIAGVGLAITNLIGVVSSYAAYGAADQQSATERV